MNTPAISSRLCLGILLVTALVALVIVADGPVQAQTPSTETVMVSNTDEDHDYVAVVGNRHLVRTIVLHWRDLHHAQESPDLCF